VVVIDASALLEFLLQTALGARVEPLSFETATSFMRHTWQTWK
jgi:hypothetical protein